MTRRLLLSILPCLFLAQPADAKELVRKFEGTGSETTAEFTVEAPWLLDWRLYADYVQLVGLEVTLIDAETGRHVGQVVYTKEQGNGLKLFDTGGTYRLRVSATLARWTLLVEQLEPEEAELYVPKRRNPLNPFGN